MMTESTLVAAHAACSHGGAPGALQCRIGGADNLFRGCARPCMSGLPRLGGLLACQAVTRLSQRTRLMQLDQWICTCETRPFAWPFIQPASHVQDSTMPVYSELVSVIVYGTAIAAPPEACRCCTAVALASGPLLNSFRHCLRAPYWLAFAGQHIVSYPCLCRTATLKPVQRWCVMHNDRHTACAECTACHPADKRL